MNCPSAKICFAILRDLFFLELFLVLMIWTQDFAISSLTVSSDEHYEAMACLGISLIFVSGIFLCNVSFLSYLTMSEFKPSKATVRLCYEIVVLIALICCFFDLQMVIRATYLDIVCLLGIVISVVLFLIRTYKRLTRGKET